MPRGRAIPFNPRWFPDLRIPVRGQGASRPLSRIYVGQAVAGLVRRVAEAEKLNLSETVARCVRAYVEKNHPDWIVE